MFWELRATVTRERAAALGIKRERDIVLVESRRVEERRGEKLDKRDPKAKC